LDTGLAAGLAAVLASAVGDQLDAAGCRLGRVADFGAEGGSAGNGDDPIGVVGKEPIVEKGFVGADNERIGCGVFVDHESGLAKGAKAFALANGIVDDAGVLSDDLARKVDHRSGLGDFTAGLAQEFAVAAIDKADLLAVRLVVHPQSGLIGNPADLGFFELAEGEQQVGKLVLGQHVEGVALVLAIVAAAAQVVQAGGWIKNIAQVVAGGDIVETVDAGFFQELVKFDRAVAFDTGVGCEAAAIGIDKGGDHAAFEGADHVEDVVLDAEQVANAAGVFDAFQGAAGAGGDIILG